MFTPPGHWITASLPIGSSNGLTRTSAPSACAARTAASRLVTRYPVRSAPNGYGTGVLNPKTERVPAGVSTSCDIVLLGVGVTVKTPGLVVLPPNVASRLATNFSKSCGWMYTCVVSYWAPTPKLESAAAVSAAINQNGAMAAIRNRFIWVDAPFLTACLRARFRVSPTQNRDREGTVQ